MSMIVDPGDRLASRPPLVPSAGTGSLATRPSTTRSTMSESGSIKMTASAPSPTAARSATAVTAPPASGEPMAAKFARALGDVSKPRTW